MFRTRFQRDIVTEFLPPARAGKMQRVIIVCDGMPSMPRKQPLAEFLCGKGYWVFYPRYRGAWERDGEFMERSPHLDILAVIGGSFGGGGANLASLDPRVKKVIANCPVVDWGILRREQKKETSNPSYAA